MSFLAGFATFALDFIANLLLSFQFTVDFVLVDFVLVNFADNFWSLAITA
jgi:hypothetical protein